MNNPQIVNALKSGKIIFLHDNRGSYLAAGTAQPEAVKRLLEITTEENQSEAFVVISEAPQMYNYVTQIPDLAWDIVEFAEKPLHIIYKGGKGVPEAVLPEGKIKVMLMLQNPLKDVLDKLRQGLLCIPVDPARVEELKADIAEAIALQPQAGLSAIKIMELGQQGEIKFLKR